MLEEPYLTPLGSMDVPFAYVFDATGITDAQAQVLNNGKALQGDSEFILRRIVGMDNVVDTKANGGRFNFKNASGSYSIGSPAGSAGGVYRHANWVVIPEKKYPKNTQIVFDLFQTLRAFNVCGASPIYTAYIAFFGVKRFALEAAYRTDKTPYKYKEKKYTYAYSLTLNTAGPSPPLRQSQLIDNYDFELQRISISYANSPGSVGALVTDDFGMTLYDCNMHQTSDLPLNQSYINNGRPTWHTVGKYQGIWPVPTLVYPAGSAINFDITSWLCANQLPQLYNIALEGIWRVPC
jgi:hypothetical protein